MTSENSQDNNKDTASSRAEGHHPSRHQNNSEDQGKIRTAMDYVVEILLFLVAPALVFFFLFQFLVGNKLPTEVDPALTRQPAGIATVPAAPENTATVGEDNTTLSADSEAGTQKKAAEESTPPLQAEPVPVSEKKSAIIVSSLQENTQPTEAASVPTDLGLPGKYPQVSTRLLTPSDLQGKTKDELALMRNELYARHSYRFKHEPAMSYFRAKEWYEPKHDDVFALFSEIEKENLWLIKAAEGK